VGVILNALHLCVPVTSFYNGVVCTVTVGGEIAACQCRKFSPVGLPLLLISEAPLKHVLCLRHWINLLSGKHTSPTHRWCGLQTVAARVRGRWPQNTEMEKPYLALHSNHARGAGGVIWNVPFEAAGVNVLPRMPILTAWPGKPVNNRLAGLSADLPRVQTCAGCDCVTRDVADNLRCQVCWASHGNDGWVHSELSL